MIQNWSVKTSMHSNTVIAVHVFSSSDVTLYTLYSFDEVNRKGRVSWSWDSSTTSGGSWGPLPMHGVSIISITYFFYGPLTFQNYSSCFVVRCQKSVHNNIHFLHRDLWASKSFILICQMDLSYVKCQKSIFFGAQRSLCKKWILLCTDFWNLTTKQDE